MAPAFTIAMSTESFGALRRHLLPAPPCGEQAAFLFARVNATERTCMLEVIEPHYIAQRDFGSQGNHYVELFDDLRAHIIRRARTLDATVIEAHSHLGHWPAAFSTYDLECLPEWVRHLQWRLGGKPYVALVFAASGFDALVWAGAAGAMSPLDAIVVGSSRVRPTGLTLATVKEEHDANPR